jgi:hypothetical protein
MDIAFVSYLGIFSHINTIGNLQCKQSSGTVKKQRKPSFVFGLFIEVRQAFCPLIFVENAWQM